MTKRHSQSEHDTLVEHIAGILKERDYEDVRADLTGFIKPRKIIWQSTSEGSFPDVTGIKDGLRIFEVETPDSINDEHTAEQWKLFASYAETNNVLFYIVFQTKSLDKVKKRMAELHINANLWGI